MNKITRPVSTRISFVEFALIRDALISHGVPEGKLMSNSAIVKTALLMTIVNSPILGQSASEESINIIKQLWKLTKRDKQAKLAELDKQ